MEINKLLLLIFTLLITGGIFFITKEGLKEQSYAETLHKIAKEVNEGKSTWVANENITEYRNANREEYFKLMGSLPKNVDERVEVISEEADDIPEEFDSRKQWPKCESIQEIRDQANCGSCWAISAAEVFSDRWCIASGQTDQTRMSSQNLVSCCDYCGNGCHGGWDDMAWLYIQGAGLVSGNLYEQDQYCQPYLLAPCDHHVKGPYGPCPDIVETPECSFSCNSKFKGEYANDRYYVKTVGSTRHSERAIQTEIMKNGPVQGSFMVYDDFLTYKSGVYQHVSGGDPGGHAIKIIGWGVENGTPYWLCANSWNYSWGENGFFKILRGKNECGIEDVTTFGQPEI